MRTLIKNVACTGQILKYYVISPIGDIEIASCREGLHTVKQCDIDDSSFSPSERCQVSLKTGQQKDLSDCEPAMKCFQWLQNYFMFRVASTDIPSLCSSVVKKDSFCFTALTMLLEAAPMGSTLTYKELAGLCGNERACRAAGRAMANNPISLLIPCHRVVTSGAGPGNYSHGKKNSIKVWLLNFEQSARTES